ncbi:MAG: sugar ABC transporter permease [Actinomycetota bacterium]|jgi:multiple sugar transport system permease protein/sn-glycerol 3-phosphate transport system permease protein|nr:sugar ABC transporter permease [Actinomycetota bacterium]MDA8302557.1 sugar ABC transporter permease [Actinomycetota bacterium]
MALATVGVGAEPGARVSKGPGARPRSSGARQFAKALPFIGPSMVGVALFLVVPVIFVFVLSFMSWSGAGSFTWAGIQNWTSIFQFDNAAHSLGVTAYYVLLNIPLQTVLALGLAVMLNRKRRGMAFFRVLYVAPYLSTPVAMALIWFWVFQPQSGAADRFLGLFGITGPAWLESSLWAMPVVAAVNIWQYLGFNMLFFYAGLQGIPPSLYEAAQLDGASKWSQFWRISLPLLNPTMLFVLITDVIGSFQVFDTLYVLTSGGPGTSTQVMSIQIYNVGFQGTRYGEAAALSVLLFGVILVFSVGQFLFFKNRTTYEY